MGNDAPGTAGKTGTKSRIKTAKPVLYKVILLNDDYTTMEFVIEILVLVFGKDPVGATSIMLHVHRNGRGIAGLFTREVAEMKIEETHARARDAGYPLRAVMERN
jgi:ATP-dependent Clp protease adaptor protein ClpS